MLINERYRLIINERQYKIKDEVQIIDSITKYAGSIKLHRFYILTDSLTLFSKIIAIISRLQKLKIENYRVLNAWEHFKPAEPIIVNTTPSTIVETPVIESLYDLKIKVLEHAYKFSRGGREFTLTDTKQISTFLENPKNYDGENRIFILAARETRSDRVMNLMKMLGEHKIYTFTLITQ